MARYRRQRAAGEVKRLVQVFNDLPSSQEGALHKKYQFWRSSPPWIRRGGRDIKKMPRSHLVRSGRGGSFNYRIIGRLNQPPRLRELRMLREIFLIAHPPLLIQGGESRPHRDFLCKAPTPTGVNSMSSLSPFRCLSLRSLDCVYVKFFGWRDAMVGN